MSATDRSWEGDTMARRSATRTRCSALVQSDTTCGDTISAETTGHFEDIASNAVPMTRLDDLYAPVVARYVDDVSGRLVAAALSCRAQVVAGAIQAERAGRPDGGYSRLRDKHSELDLMCVVPEFRSGGSAGS